MWAAYGSLSLVPWILFAQASLNMDAVPLITPAQPEVFVSAADAARHGIETANSKAGVVFQKFGEACSVRTTP